MHRHKEKNGCIVQVTVITVFLLVIIIKSPILITTFSIYYFLFYLKEKNIFYEIKLINLHSFTSEEKKVELQFFVINLFSFFRMQIRKERFHTHYSIHREPCRHATYCTVYKSMQKYNLNTYTYCTLV